MLKMEKNFVAVIEKGYPRYPYKAYALTLEHLRELNLIYFVEREIRELVTAFEMLDGATAPNVELTAHVREEIADVSNCLDYLYEAVLKLEIEWMQK